MFIIFLLFLCLTLDVSADTSSLVDKKKIVFHYDDANKVLSTIPYNHNFPIIITEHEWKEFQLDRLITNLDRTKTSFGRWGLKNLLCPIADYNELMVRKNVISFLVENDQVFSYLQDQLEKIHAVEKSLLAYWDRNDALDKSCEQFYYVMPFVKEHLNSNNLALNASFGTKMLDAWMGLIASLCLSGIQAETTDWLIGNKDFDFWRAIGKGFREPLRQHSFELDVMKEDAPEAGYGYKDYMKAMMLGTWADRYKVFSTGYTFDAAKLGLPSFFSYGTSKATSIIGKGVAAIFATGQTAFYDYHWGSSLFAIGTHLISMTRSLEQLQGRIVDVASGCKAINNITRVIQKYPNILSNRYMTDEYDKKVADCFRRLSDSRFLHKQKYLYSRGHVLQMHKDLKLIKQLLVPILQSVSFVDAYCSIAQLYKEGQGRQATFTFPEFIEQDTPLLFYENAWLALLPHEQAITNNLCLGGNCQSKIVITGPNGGGKSTILKQFGVEAIMAQGWLLNSATRAQQTLFSVIKTGFSISENLTKNLSTGMAEKKRMIELSQVIKLSEVNKNKILVLIDEPYKGTVDDEAAKRIYQFGKDVAEFSQVLLAIATHVKKPIFLESDTNGIFGNYQVKIRETSYGNFERLFKLEKGPAIWWFEDADQRSRFLDWLDTKLSDSD